MKLVLLFCALCSGTWRPLVGQISIQILQYYPTKFMTERTKQDTEKNRSKIKVMGGAELLKQFGFALE